MATGAIDTAASDYGSLTQNVAVLIQASRHIQLARVNSYLDGIVLAAEQVQDMRIELLENPEEPTGWKLFGHVLLTLALESTVGGRVLAAVTKKIFTSVLRQHTLFMALPKSPTGAELLRQARELTSHLPRGKARAERLEYLLQVGVNGPGLDALGRENVQLYHSWLEGMIRTTSDGDTNHAAVVKAGREWFERKQHSGSLANTDTAGVAILGAAQHYASITRLGIEVRHARFESLVRDRQVPPAGLAVIIDAFGWEDLEIAVHGQKVSVDLSNIRTRYKLLFEATIWAALYRFSSATGTPEFAGDNYVGVPSKLTDYWFRRFAENVDAWNRQPIPFLKQPRQAQVDLFRKYFWAIAGALPKIRADEFMKPLGS